MHPTSIGITTRHLACLLGIALAPFASGAEEAKQDKMTVEYNSPGPHATHGVTMETALNALGITLEKIDYVRLVGDEGSGTSGQSKKVKIDDWFWDRYFVNAEPYKFWLSSGDRKLEIYLKGETKPKATILINETDSCSVDGDPRKLRYMCHGLNQWFLDEIGKKATAEAGK